MWSFFVLILSGIPGNTTHHYTWFQEWNVDKVIHVSMYCVLTFFLLWELKGKQVFVALLYGVGYGILMEILQHFIFIRRSFELNDIFANSFGCVLGILLFFGFFSKKI